MKQTIFGSPMIISGVIGFALTIHANAAKSNQYSRIWGGMRFDEWLFASSFLVLACAVFISHGNLSRKIANS